MAKTLRKRSYDYNDTIATIMQTSPGMERNMYSFIKEIFVNTLGFGSNDVIIDSRINTGGIPDLMINTGGMIRWSVVEVKDESGVFGNINQRQTIFSSKHRYIGIDTEWFIFIDPEYIVIRPVHLGMNKDSYNAEADKVFKWKDLQIEAQFSTALYLISARSAADNSRVVKFRDGDESMIASVKLISDYDKAIFLDSLKLAVDRLNTGFMVSVSEMKDNIFAIAQEIKHFQEKFTGSEVITPNFSVTGGGVNVDNKKEFRQKVHELKKLYHMHYLPFRIANEYVVESTRKEKNEILKEFIAETVNLVISRIILLRFFEDHKFFGKKYLCNGGVKAFQNMKKYFKKKYPILLRLAYEEGSKIYEAVFEESVLDWILYSDNDVLSNAIERSMFYLAQFDFSTIKEDILSGIYSELIPARQRKALGQHYTPPSIARYLVDKTGMKHDKKMLDPACGLGTFLVEGYNIGIGRQVARGRYNFEDVCHYLNNIRGNDINVFSSTISQMQIIWNILSFKADITTKGFPLLFVSGGHDSLRVQRLFGQIDDWADIDTDEYDVVAGNPPYVRPERQQGEFTGDEIDYYMDISHQSDLYSLFIFKAMKSWLKDNGYLGFVLPLSFLDNDSNSNLRQFFSIGGPWKIIEIFDLEEISEIVFPDCTVNPILFIAQKITPSENDTVTLRVGTIDNVKFDMHRNVIGFDLENATTNVIPYADIWTEDGRILTRITPERKRIIDKIEAAATARFKDLAMEYWVGLKRNTIEKWAKNKPDTPDGLRWESRRMLCRGAVFRRQVHKADDGTGYAIFKGENITPCLLEGLPVETNIDAQKMSSPSLWKYPDLLPENGFAFAMIALSPIAAPFNPQKQCLLDTATPFIPREDIKDFPLDFTILSNVYRWYYAIKHREGVISKFWSHIYPSTIERLPWTDNFLPFQNMILDLRTKWLEACREKARSREVFFEKIKELAIETLSERFDRIETLAMAWPDAATEKKAGETWYRIHIGDLYNYFDINHQDSYEEIQKILPIYGVNIDRNTVLSLQLPRPEAKKEWIEAISQWQNSDADQRIMNAIYELDTIIADAFDIVSELPFILSDIKDDRLFKMFTPRLPYIEKSLRGLLKGLERADRYSA